MALLPVVSAGLAQSTLWSPEKNVEIVVSVAQGGGTDTTARLVQRMFERLGLVATSLVVNKPGGGGAETWAYLDGLAGSGRHIAISTPQLLTNRIIGADPLTYSNFTPLTNLYSEFVLIAVRVNSPLNTGRDLATRLRQDFPPVSVAVAPALGSHNHIAPALVAKAAGGDPRRLQVEVFKTGSDAALAAIEGRVDIVSSTVGTLLEQVQAGKLRPLGLTSARRLGGPLAVVPTWKEQGVDVVLPSWRGVVGPRGMPRAQIAYWEEVFLKLSFSDEWLAEIRKRWWESTYLSSDETRGFLEGQYGLLKSALTDIGLGR
jgi:putative tricarboxylic transport membrane protein